jgi:branched-chain amino acid transport system ATP-binding protein
MRSEADPVTTVLELVGVDAGYDGVPVLRGIDLAVAAGQFVALIGANGAGKTTLLRTASGLLRPTAGSVRVRGVDVTDDAANRRARLGLCLIPEGRGVFRSLSVRDNLRMQVPPWSTDCSFDRAIDAFPVLGQRLNQIAGTMSGGQQQMLALARAYLSSPQIVLLDEVSMGLAPLVVDEIFAALQRLARSGTALLLVEQYVNRALQMADRALLLDRGSISYDGPADVLDQSAVLHSYLGNATEESVRASPPVPATPPAAEPVPPQAGDSPAF